MELEAKKTAIAKILDGKVVDDSNRVAVCIKGSLLGFPTTVEAFRPGFPFGVNYYLETETETERVKQNIHDPFKISIRPRYVKGILAFVSRIFLFESRGEKVGSKEFESRYVCLHNDYETAERFIRYPGVQETIQELEKISQFNELVARAKYGVFLSHSKSFKGLDVDEARETLKHLSNLGQVLFDAF